MTLEEYEELMAQVRSMAGSVALSSPAIDKPVKKSKRSKYNRELSKQLKKVKEMHPRTLQKDLMAKGQYRFGGVG